MKRMVMFVITACFLVMAFVVSSVDMSSMRALAQIKEPTQIKMPEVIVLGQDSKLGKVTFNHVKHNGGDYTADGTGPIACIECHHTAQPAAELVKYPPLKTAWPADRTTTLTADLFNKDPKAAGVAACRDCHARVGQVPKLMPEIPVVKQPGSTTLLTLTNQMAFHKNCDVCHFEVRAQRPGIKAPNATQCTSCHKRTVAAGEGE